MALALDSVKALVTVRDKGGNDSSMSFVFRGTDIAAAETYVTGTLVPALNAIIDGLVVSAHVTARYLEDTLVLPADACEVENIALVVVRIDGEVSKTANLRIPTPNVGIFSGAEGEDYNIVDIADAALLTYVGMWQDSGDGLGDSTLLLSDGEVVDFDNPVKAGKRIHRASRSG